MFAMAFISALRFHCYCSLARTLIRRCTTDVPGSQTKQNLRATQIKIESKANVRNAMLYILNGPNCGGFNNGVVVRLS